MESLRATRKVTPAWRIDAVEPTTTCPTRGSSIEGVSIIVECRHRARCMAPPTCSLYRVDRVYVSRVQVCIDMVGATHANNKKAN